MIIEKAEGGVWCQEVCDTVFCCSMHFIVGFAFLFFKISMTVPMSRATITGLVLTEKTVTRVSARQDLQEGIVK